MSYFDNYKSRVNALGSTPTEVYKSALQAVSNQKFQYSSTFYYVKYKNRATGNWSDIGVRLTKPKNFVRALSISDDYFEMIFQDFDTEIFLGDLFEFQNYRWMVVNTEGINTVTNSVIIARCNVQLKFIESTPTVMPTVTSTIYTVDGVASIKIQELNEDKYLLLPSNQMMIEIPNDSTARKIKDSPQGTRFILGNPAKAWKVIAVDSVTKIRRTIESTPNDYNGIISLRLQSDNINTSVDNVSLGIAKQFG